MKQRFKIGDILRYEDNDTIDIFKVSQIQIDKTTNEVKYISIFQETFIDDGNGSLELYQEQYKTPNAIVSNSPCDPMLNIPTMTTNCPPNNLPNDLPKTWEEVNMLALRNELNADLKKRYVEICDIIYNLPDSVSNETWKYINFMKLLLLRDIYKEKDISDDPYHYYAIIYADKEIEIYKYRYDVEIKSPFVFLSQKNANLFLSNFKYLIEKCKEFI